MTAQWAVWLAGRYAPYDKAISDEVEQAWQRGEDEALITVRAARYIIAFKPAHAMKQKLESDPGKQRAVQRTAEPAPAPAAAVAHAPAAPSPAPAPPPPMAGQKRPIDDDATDEDEPPPAPASPPAAAAAAPPPPAAAAGGSSDDDPMGPLADGETRSVAGSGANTYTIKRTGDSYFCSCPAWRNQHTNPRTCKHLKALRGEAAELKRLGGDHKAFFASGNKVAGVDAPAGSGGGGTANQEVAKSIALASSWDGTSELVGWALSEKLDGQRAFWDGHDRLWTRTGNEIYPPLSLISSLPTGVPLDGELFLGRGQFQRLMTISRRTDCGPLANAAWEPVEYVVFDAPKAAGGIFDRLKAAQAALDAVPAAAAAAAGAPAAPRVRLLEHERCTGADHIRSRMQQLTALGAEGLVTRHPTAAFKPGRSTDLLKVKESKDDEALVIGHEPGKGKHAGRMGALQCKLRSGKQFKVGTGFSDAERESPPAVGTVITFAYFELTNDHIPRFPTYSRVRPDVSASEFD